MSDWKPRKTAGKSSLSHADKKKESRRTGLKRENSWGRLCSVCDSSYYCDYYGCTVQFIDKGMCRDTKDCG